MFKHYKSNAFLDLLEGEGEQLKHGSLREFSHPLLENESNVIIPNKVRKHIDPANEQEISLKFHSTLSTSGKIWHHFQDDLHRYNRRSVFPSGRAYFDCTIKGCKAKVRARYSSKEMFDLEEPVVDKVSLPPLEAHNHPGQAGGKLVEEARRRMKEQAAKDVEKSIPDIYRDVYDEIMNSCEAKDKEDFRVLCPSLKAVEASLYRHRRDLITPKALLKGTKLGRKVSTFTHQASSSSGSVKSDEENGIPTFYSKTSSSGKVWHSFEYNLYRFDRKNVTSNGRAYFSCSFQGCKAILKADYTSKDNCDR